MLSKGVVKAQRRFDAAIVAAHGLAEQMKPRLRQWY
jgi:hypothetical protein